MRLRLFLTSKFSILALAWVSFTACSGGDDGDSSDDASGGAAVATGGSDEGSGSAGSGSAGSGGTGSGSAATGGSQPGAGGAESGSGGGDQGDGGDSPEAGGTDGGGAQSTGGAPAAGGMQSATGGDVIGSGGSNPGGGSDLAAEYPCDGSTDGYDAVVTESGGSWTVRDESGQEVWSGQGMMAAMAQGFQALDSGRTSKQSVLVQGDGTMAADQRLDIPSHLILNVCGTIDVQGTPGSDMSPFYVRGKTDVDIPHAAVTGTPAYGMFFRETSNVHLGHIEFDLELDSWIGIRFDNKPSWPDFPPLVTNLTIDYVKVTSSGSHGVETYGVDGIHIGEFVGDHTGGCGVLLNHSINARVDSVTCDECAYIDTGYAAFRVANDNGKIGSEWPADNIHVGSVYARGGGRGIFSVSGSGGLTIDTIDIADTGNNAILLQNAYNTTIAADAGTISSGTVILSNDTDNTNDGTYEPSSNVTLQNLTLSNGASVSEAWCDLGDRGNRAVNVTGGSVNMCF